VVALRESAGILLRTIAKTDEGQVRAILLRLRKVIQRLREYESCSREMVREC